MFRKILFTLLVSFCWCISSSAQTQKKDIGTDFFEFDQYPFELAESFGKWGLIFKPVYDKQLAIAFFKRNFHYNNRIDTLMNNDWLVPPLYTKFERWSYGPRFQFMVGIRGKKKDLFTLSGELLARDFTQLHPEKISDKQRGIIISMRAAGKWKWFYEGDFYNSNTTVYYQSEEFDKLEIVRDTVLSVYNFMTEKQGSTRQFNEVGHEFSGEVVYAFKPEPPAEQEEKEVAALEKKTEAGKETAAAELQVMARNNEQLMQQLKEEKEKLEAEKKAMEEVKRAAEAEKAKIIAELKTKAAEEIKAAVAKALKEAEEAREKEKKADEATRYKAIEDQVRLTSAIEIAEANKEIELLKASLETEKKARIAAEQKAAEAEEKARAAAGQQAAEENKRIAEAEKEKAEREQKIASLYALKEAEEQARIAAEQEAMEEAKRLAEMEKAKAAAEEKARVEEEEKNAALKALKEMEAEKARSAAEEKARAEELRKIAELNALKEAEEKARIAAELKKAKAEQEIKAAVSKALKEAEEAKEKARIAAEAKAKAENEKSLPVKKVDTVRAPELIEDRNIIFRKILDRDKLKTYTVYAEKNLFGLKSAEGKVLIYPVMKSIHITTPSNVELKITTTYAAIELVGEGLTLKITDPDFAGPESLGTHTVKCASCSGGSKTAEIRWNKGKGKYE